VHARWSHERHGCAFIEWPIFETVQDLSTTGGRRAAVIGLISETRLSNGRQHKLALGKIGARRPNCPSPVHSCLDATPIRKRCCREVGGADIGNANAPYHRILQIGRTIADLAGAEDLSPSHMSEAIQYRSLDRRRAARRVRRSSGFPAPSRCPTSG
jgi:magnesium chelatase subunit ChlI-like protein